MAECCAVRGFHHVPGLRQASPEGPEEISGRTAESQRGAERRQVKGETRAIRGCFTFPGEGLLSWKSLFAAKAHRRSGHHPSYAEVCRVVRRIHARVHCEYSYFLLL